MSISQFYQPGDLIYTGEPFVCILKKEYQGIMCDGCLESTLPLKKCNACKYVSYCGKQCQKKSWPDHRMECAHLKKIPKENSDFYRLLGKCILKMKNKSLSECKEKVVKLSFTFESMPNFSAEARNGAKLNLYAAEKIHHLQEFIGKENVSEESKLVEIIEKVLYNKFNISGKAIGLYIGGSHFAHSCIPNAVAVFRGKTLHVRAIQRISKDDLKKVTIAYQPVLKHNENEREIIKAMFETCNCMDCNLPYGDSILSKVTDKTMAYSIVSATGMLLKKLKDMPPELMFHMESFCDLTEVLHKLDSVVGETNVLRMGVLTILAQHAHPDLQETYLKELIRCAKLAFGEYSSELQWMYKQMITLCMRNHDIVALQSVHQKMTKLIDVHRGTADAAFEIFISRFLRHPFFEI